MKNDEIDHVAESYRAELRQLIERVKKYADDDLIVNMLAARRTGIEKKLMELNALRSGPPKPETFPLPTPGPGKVCIKCEGTGEIGFDAIGRGEETCPRCQGSGLEGE